MYDSDLYERIHAEVSKVKIIDTHEHLSYPHELQEMGRIDFGRLFSHYTSSDLVSAGMLKEDMEKVGERSANSGWTPQQKWRALKPYYERTWNTAYFECIRIAIRDLYGIDDLRDDTIEPLSEKMNSIPRKAWTREVFDRAGIDMAMENRLDGDSIYSRKHYPNLFLCDMIDYFSVFDIENRDTRLGKETGIDVYDLQDYLKVIDWYFDKFADEASALKFGHAYVRTLLHDEVQEHDAARIFADMQRYNAQVPAQDMRALENFIVHYCVRKAGDYSLPVKFHTGLQEGNGNDIRNSRAALLINLFLKYPKVKFNIYHISWPYTEELVAICKSFPNVYVDFCWAWIFNPPASRRYLSDMLETVPLTKINGFGGDFIFVEGTYGHSVIARREIARVMAEKVQEGRFSEEYAVRVAERILRGNALETFHIEEKTRLVAERSVRAEGLSQQ